MERVRSKQDFGKDDFPESREISIKKGELLLYEGDEHANRAFVVLSGRLEVRLISGTGHETLLYHLHPGELVGELPAFGVKARTATIAASVASTLLEVPYASFVQKMQDCGFVEKVAHHFLTRYLRTHEEVCRLGQPNVAMKLCRYFKTLADQKEHQGDVVEISLPSHAEMSKLLSCQRETITREMKKLIYAGVIVPREKPSYFELHVKKKQLFMAGMLD